MKQASRNLQALVAEFYTVWFRFHPDAALSAGVAGYAGTMPAVEDDDIGALGSWLESTIVGLEEIDFHSLEPAEQLDLELLFGACRDEYQAILECDWRHRNPRAFMPLRTICRLVLGAETQGYGALEACLTGVPQLLRQARSRLSEYPGLVPRIWVDAALQEGAAGSCFLKQLGDQERELPSGLRVRCEQVSEAVTDYLEFLAAEIAPGAEGSTACGWQRFQEQLLLRHHLSDKLGDHLEMARRTYQETKAELSAYCVEHTGSVDPRIWLEKLSRRPSLKGDARLQFVRRCSTEIHGLLADAGIFTLPEPTTLELRSMPEDFPLGCAPEYLPPVYGANDSPGVLYLRQASLAAGADTPEWLTAWCIRNAWPGRHLQSAAAADDAPGISLVRRSNELAGQRIGWALYGEQLVQELGMFAAPEQTLQSLLERLRRALMAVLDIELHVHGMAASGALLQLQNLPGRTAEEAAGDLLDLTRRPAQHLAGIANWKLLDALKQQQVSEGEGDLAGFHARLLGQGSVAMPLVIRRVFGAAAWASVEAQVYSQ